MKSRDLLCICFVVFPCVVLFILYLFGPHP